MEITVKLDLRNNNLQDLPRGAFSHTPYLTHLNLQRCNIIRVKEGAFRALGRVVSLNLAYNKIEILYQVSTCLKKTGWIVDLKPRHERRQGFWLNFAFVIAGVL